MRRYLRLLMMAELDAVEMCRSRHAAPSRVAPRPGRVEVANVDCAVLHQIPAGLRRVLALPRANGDPSAGADLTHVAMVVGPQARLFEPADVQLSYAFAQLEGHRQAIPLIGVDSDGEILVGGFACCPNSIAVLARCASSHLELAPAESHLLPLCHLIPDGP